MLTQNDRTVPDARGVLDAVVQTGLSHIGFKDVGATPRLQGELVDAARAAGLTTYLEVVSETVEGELAASSAAKEAGVDWVIGGTAIEKIAAELEGSGIKFAPFPGKIVGHPSELQGSIEEIAAHAAAIMQVDGVHGIDLLAYRHRSVDPLELTTAVTAVVDGPVIAAGSITTREQIEGLAAAGAWGFTIGGAVFDGLLSGDDDVVAQVDTALRFAAGAHPSRATP